MLELKRTRDKTLLAGTNRWSFHMDAPEPNRFTMTFGKTLVVESLAAQPGEFAETLALPDRRRPHVHADGDEISIEAYSTIPFGEQPAIQRKFRLDDHQLSVTSDLVLRNSFEMRNLFAGGLSYRGDITAFGLLGSARDGVIPPVKLRDWAEVADGTILFDSPEPPLTLAVRNAEDVTVTFHPGEDYWRWIHAARLHATSRFLIRKESDGSLCFEWHLLEWSPKHQDDRPPAGRNWRLTWSLDWKFKAPRKKAKQADFKTSFDLLAQDWPADARCVAPDGTTLDLPCASSPIVINSLKRWVRAQLADASEGDVFAILNAMPHVCSSASHMERPKFKILPHSDAIPLYDFQRWANRQLAPSGARLVLVSEEQ